MYYLGMAEVGTFLQLVSWFGDSWESLALHHDLTWGEVLGQRIPPSGVGVLLYLSLGLQILKIYEKQFMKLLVSLSIILQ